MATMNIMLLMAAFMIVAVPFSRVTDTFLSAQKDLKFLDMLSVWRTIFFMFTPPFVSDNIIYQRKCQVNISFYTLML